jgi:hypothetical protein
MSQVHGTILHPLVKLADKKTNWGEVFRMRDQTQKTKPTYGDAGQLPLAK